MGQWQFKGQMIEQFWTVGQWQAGKFVGVASTGKDGQKAPVAKQGWN